MKRRGPKEQDLAIEISFLEGLRQRLPEDPDILKVLGDDYTRSGRWEDGLRVDVELSRLLPKDPLVHYNFACSLALTGKVKDAAEALLRAVQLGYREWIWIRTDPDLENLRKSPEYERIHQVILSHSKQKV